MKKLLCILIAVSLILQPRPEKAKAEVLHTHSQDCYSTHNHEAGGCKQHSHSGSPETEEGCYRALAEQDTPGCGFQEGDWECQIQEETALLHTCAGNEEHGGGCYIQPMYHEHNDSCRMSLPPIVVPNMGHSYSSSGASDSVGFKVGLDTIATLLFSTDMRAELSYRIYCDWTRYGHYLVDSSADGTKYNTLLRELRTVWPLGGFTGTLDFESFIEKCPKTTQFILPYLDKAADNFGCSRTREYVVCGKSEATIECYEKACGKISGKYYLADGREASPMCDIVVTRIAPASINVPYQMAVEAGEAAADYLDGHTGKVAVTTDYDPALAACGESKEYTASYTGRVNRAAEGIGTLTAPITINTLGVQRFTLENKKQIIYKGMEPDYSGWADYGAAGSFAVQGTFSDFDDTIAGREQRVTVIYEGGREAADTMQVLVLPKPVRIEAEKIEAKRGIDKEVTLTAYYEDGTKRDFLFHLSEEQKNYRDSYSLGDVTASLRVAWINKNPSETGRDYRTGGEYTLEISFQGISTCIDAEITDVCSVNERHSDFKHDICPICQFTAEKEAEFNGLMEELEEIKSLAQRNKKDLERRDFPAESKVISRDTAARKELEGAFNERCNSLEEILQNYTRRLEELREGWKRSMNQEEASVVLEKARELVSKGCQSVITEYNGALEIWSKAEELAAHKDMIGTFLPEITISGDLDKVYDGKPAAFSACVTVADIDHDFVNPVEYYYQEGAWKVLDTEFIDAGSYILKAVTQDKDYLTAEKQFHVVIRPKELQADFTGTDKIYDGTDRARLAVSLKGVVSGDLVTASDLAGTYVQSSIGNNLPILSKELIKLEGRDAGNYSIAPLEITGNILPAPLMVTARAENAEYGERPDFEFIYTGFVKGENESCLADALTISADTASAGSGKQKIHVRAELRDGTNYTITAQEGEMVFFAPKDYQKIQLPFLEENQEVIVDGRVKNLDKPFEIWHPKDKDIIVQQRDITWSISKNGKISILLPAALGEIKIHKDTVEQGDKVYGIPDSSVLITGKGQEYNVIADGFHGEVCIESWEGKELFIKDGSDAVLVLVGDNKTENITVQRDSRLTILGEGTLTVGGGIGGSETAAGGNIMIAGGDITAGWIGNHPAYAGEQGDHVTMDGGRIETDSILPSLEDSEGNELRRIQIELGSIEGTVFYYTRRADSTGKMWETVPKNRKITVIIEKDAKKIYVTSGKNSYWVHTAREPYKLIPIGSSGSNGGSGGGSSTGGSNEGGHFSSGGKTEKPEETVGFDRTAKQVAEYINRVMANSKGVALSSNLKGKTSYINTRELVAREGYELSSDGNHWSERISSGKTGYYTDYVWFVKNLSEHTVQKILLPRVCVDYVKPKAVLNSSDKKIKINTRTKNMYGVLVNKKLTFRLDVDFGISGKKRIQYQTVNSGKKLKAEGWKNVTGNKVTITPRGKQRVYLRYEDKAGNVTVEKTIGYTADRIKPKINVKDRGEYKKGKKLQVTDSQSGVGIIKVNGKRVKNGYALKRAGIYKIVAQDKAGNKALVTVTIR